MTLSGTVLVKILNDFESLIIIKLREKSHSFAGFSNYITTYFIDKYSDKKNCDNNNNNNIYLKFNIYSTIRYKFSGLYKDKVSTLWLYNAYKEFPKIVSTQLCNYTVISISIVLLINNG